MNDRVFLDTNVLVYAFDDAEPGKQERAWGILEAASIDMSVVISTQVLQEFYVTVVRRLEKPLGEKDAEQAVVRFSKLPVVQVDTQMIRSAIRTSRRYKLSFWDALIIQAAIEGNCGRLLSEDLQDGFVVGSLRVENPFAMAQEES